MTRLGFPWISGNDKTGFLIRSTIKNDIQAIKDNMAYADFLPDGTIVSANSSFLDVVGYNLNAILEKYHGILCHLTDFITDEYLHFWKNWQMVKQSLVHFSAMT